MEFQDEFDLSLSVSRRRCAVADTLEWRLVLGDTPIVTRWLSKSVSPTQAIGQLLNDLTRAAPGKETKS